MIPLLLDYASPSVFSADGAADTLGLAANARRPVRFRGRVRRNPFLLRVALRALGQAIWSNDTWVSDGVLLDPVITVHPDRLILEAFSSDQSSALQVMIDPDLFETDGPVTTGTTNVDFSAWLWGALGEMRSSRETWFSIDSGGFAVATVGGGGRHEAKVDLPDDWVRGFLQVQAGMAMPGTRLSVRPVDLLAAIRFLRYTKAKLSPRALRFEFHPGKEAQLVLEPWEHVVPLRGLTHDHAELRTVRLWGRRRLALIEPLLPFADRVDIHLKGRGLPSFWSVHLPCITFLLGITGWSGQGWTGAGSFDLLQDRRRDDVLTERAGALLRERFTLRLEELCAQTGADRPSAAAALARLCRLGRALFDIGENHYRHRELFEQPLDEARLYPPDERVEAARAHLAAGEVAITACAVRETRKTRELPSPEGPQRREIVFRDWAVEGRVGDQPTVETVINDRGAVIFGRCGCRWFQDHLLGRGPCQHMLALQEASAPHRVDLPSSQAAPAPTVVPEDLDDEAGEDDDVQR